MLWHQPGGWPDQICLLCPECHEHDGATQSDGEEAHSGVIPARFTPVQTHRSNALLAFGRTIARRADDPASTLWFAPLWCPKEMAMLTLPTAHPFPFIHRLARRGRLAVAALLLTVLGSPPASPGHHHGNPDARGLVAA